MGMIQRRLFSEDRRPEDLAGRRGGIHLRLNLCTKEVLFVFSAPGCTCWWSVGEARLDVVVGWDTRIAFSDPMLDSLLSGLVRIA